MSGSATAIGGYKYEHKLVEQFVDWEFCSDARDMLGRMGNSLALVESVAARKVKGSVKPDIEVGVKFSSGDEKQIPISVKKCKLDFDYNHICRTSVENYSNIFGIDNTLGRCLAVFTGEMKPSENMDLLKSEVSPSGKRKTFNDFKPEYASLVVEWLEANKKQVVNYAFCGSGQKPEFLIIGVESEEGINPHIYKMDDVVSHFYKKPVSISSRGSIRLGNGEMVFQREGGTGQPTNLQIKFKPSEVLKNVQKPTCESLAKITGRT